MDYSDEINIDNTPKVNTKQIDFYDYKKDYFIDRIINIDIDNLTPIEALSLLNDIIKDANNFKGKNNG